LPSLFFGLVFLSPFISPFFFVFFCLCFSAHVVSSVAYLNLLETKRLGCLTSFIS
jgi:hypothetical protein